MRRQTNPLLALAVAAMLSAPHVAAESLTQRAERDAEIDALMLELAEEGLRTWQSKEDQITALWSRSGSATIDLLLQRGVEALEEEDFLTAIEHLTAVTDHAPDFAEGWNARATAFYLMDEYGLALDDLQHALALNPDHFTALTGAAVILNEMGHPYQAIEMIRRAEALNPNRENIQNILKALQREIGEATL